MSERVILHSDMNCFYASVETVSYTHLDEYKRQRPYRLLLCVMISLLVIMLAGCSTSSDSDTNTRGFTDFATTEEEYLTKMCIRDRHLPLKRLLPERKP